MTPAAIIYYYPGSGGSSDMLGDGWRRLIPAERLPRFEACTRLANSPGPDAGRGLLITRQQDVLVTYDPDTQDWRRIGDRWVGIRRDYTAEELARTDRAGRLVAPGYSVPLGDGRDYTVPVALADAPGYRIPWRETITEDGAFARETDPRYRAVCDAAAEMWGFISEDAEFQMDEDRLRVACVNALQVNYTIDLTDCLALGLFTPEAYRAMVSAILDLPALDELVKKKAREPYATDFGVRAASDDTSPHTPTSQP